MQKKLAFGFFGIIVFTFIAANIYVSQFSYHPLMFRLITLQDAPAADQFLADLEGTSVYPAQLRYFNSLFDNVFTHEIDIKHLNTDNSINYYEKILKLNGKNRDVLIKLALLYKENGNTKKSADYYRAAKKIDPWVKIAGLE